MNVLLGPTIRTIRRQTNRESTDGLFDFSIASSRSCRPVQSSTCMTFTPGDSTNTNHLHPWLYKDRSASRCQFIEDGSSEESFPPPAKMAPWIIQLILVVLRRIEPKIFFRHQPVTWLVECQQFIGTLDQYKLHIGLGRTVVVIGVMLPCGFPVGILQIGYTRIVSHAEDLARGLSRRQITVDTIHKIEVVLHSTVTPLFMLS